MRNIFQLADINNLQGGAETDVRIGVRSIVVVPVAGRIVPANRTVRRQTEITLSRCCTFSDGLFSVVDEELLQSSNDAPDLLELSLQFQEFLLRDVLLVLGDT